MQDLPQFRSLWSFVDLGLRLPPSDDTRIDDISLLEAALLENTDSLPGLSLDPYPPSDSVST